MKSTLATAISEKARLTREKFALLAKVGVRKREALAFHEAEQFYSTLVTELLAALEDEVAMLRTKAQTPESLQEREHFLVSTQHRLIRKLLTFWPKNTESQQLLVTLLDSPGVAKFLDYSGDGYASLSGDQILENVASIIEASMEQDQKH